MTLDELKKELFEKELHLKNVESSLLECFLDPQIKQLEDLEVIGKYDILMLKAEIRKLEK